MDHQEAKWQENREKLKAAGLNFIFESESKYEFDLRIETLSGQVLVADIQYHIDPAEWLDENINEAICLANNLKQTVNHCVDALALGLQNTVLTEATKLPDDYVEKLKKVDASRWKQEHLGTWFHSSENK